MTDIKDLIAKINRLPSAEDLLCGPPSDYGLVTAMDITTDDLKALVQRLERAEQTIYEIAKYYPTKGMVKIAPMRAVEEINKKVSVYLEERE